MFSSGLMTEGELTSINILEQWFEVTDTLIFFESCLFVRDDNNNNLLEKWSADRLMLIRSQRDKLAATRIIPLNTTEVTLEKRTYLPILIKSTCPKCGQPVEMNLSDNSSYLSYPTINKPFDLKFYHQCLASQSTEWSYRVILRVSLLPVLQRDAESMEEYDR